MMKDRLFNPYPGGAIRLNYLRGPLRPFWPWLRKFVRELFPRRYFSSDTERHRWLLKPRFTSRYEMVPGPYLEKGDPGFETATHEVGFIRSAGSFERLEPNHKSP